MNAGVNSGSRASSGASTAERLRGDDVPGFRLRGHCRRRPRPRSRGWGRGPGRAAADQGHRLRPAQPGPVRIHRQVYEFRRPVRQDRPEVWAPADVLVDELAELRDFRDDPLQERGEFPGRQAVPVAGGDQYELQHLRVLHDRVELGEQLGEVEQFRARPAAGGRPLRAVVVADRLGQVDRQVPPVEQLGGHVRVVAPKMISSASHCSANSRSPHAAASCSHSAGKVWRREGRAEVAEQPGHHVVVRARPPDAGRQLAGDDRPADRPDPVVAHCRVRAGAGPQSWQRQPQRQRPHRVQPEDGDRPGHRRDRPGEAVHARVDRLQELRAEGRVAVEQRDDLGRLAVGAAGGLHHLEGDGRRVGRRSGWTAASTADRAAGSCSCGSEPTGLRAGAEDVASTVRPGVVGERRRDTRKVRHAGNAVKQPEQGVRARPYFAGGSLRRGCQFSRRTGRAKPQAASRAAESSVTNSRASR